MIRVAIADDHTLFRVGLRQVLERIPDVVIVAECASAPEALHLVQNEPLDLLLCDLTMPGTTGVDLIAQIRKACPKLPLLVLSMHDEAATIRRAIQAGATGYLTKEASPNTLQEALLTVASGASYLPARLSTELAMNALRPTPLAHDTLSTREREVFRLIVEGTSLAQIAEQLHLSPKTITTHKTHLMEKLGIENNAELIRYALEHRVFD
jgi:DNA-binding NarL/FixJ family response regulator